jgi:hypothetical protein
MTPERLSSGRYSITSSAMASKVAAAALRRPRADRFLSHGGIGPTGPRGDVVRQRRLHYHCRALRGSVSGLDRVLVIFLSVGRDFHLVPTQVRRPATIRPSTPGGRDMATKERLAAMAASRCAVCSGPMVVKSVEADPNDNASELRTYVCAECGHERAYSVTAGNN